MTGGWDALWSARQPPASEMGASVLRRLMDADGMDSGFARVEEPAWRAFVTRAATALELRPGESVFEVGCGAGAFVAPLREAGCAVSGIDRSPGLVELARASDLGGDFAVADASKLDVTPAVDVVVSMLVTEHSDTVAARRSTDPSLRPGRRKSDGTGRPIGPCRIGTTYLARGGDRQATRSCQPISAGMRAARSCPCSSGR